MRLSLLVLTCLFAACSSALPLGATDPDAMLAEADRLLAAGNPTAAASLLGEVSMASLPKKLQPRGELLQARAQAALGEHIDAYVTLREFSDRHPHSDLREAVMQLLYRSGEHLIRSDGGFLFFWSDKHGGRTVLEHLITRYPDTVHLADALRLLGDDAFASEDYDLAQERYRELLKRRPESEWAPYARYRYAMGIVGNLRGPEYDFDLMQQARRELADFLATPSENQQHLQVARETAERLRGWTAARHLIVAAYYHRLGNELGRRIHLERAATPEFEGTPQCIEARDLLAGHTGVGQ